MPDAGRACVVCGGPTDRPFCAACMAQANRDADAAEAGREATRRTCSACSQVETRILRMDGTDPYWLHLDNEIPHCEARQAPPADSYSSGGASS